LPPSGEPSLPLGRVSAALRLLERRSVVPAPGLTGGFDASFVATAMACHALFFACTVSRHHWRLRGHERVGEAEDPSEFRHRVPREGATLEQQGSRHGIPGTDKSFESTVPSTVSATRSKNASPVRAPAGDGRTRRATQACSKRGSSERSSCARTWRRNKVISASGCPPSSATVLPAASGSAGTGLSVAMLDPSTTIVYGHVRVVKPPTRSARHFGLRI